MSEVTNEVGHVVERMGSAQAATDTAKQRSSYAARIEHQVSLHRPPLVIPALLFSDILLALVIWDVGLVVQSVWGHGSASQLAYLNVPANVAVWIVLRLLLGLYPGYGIDEAEELRRQTHAVIGTLAITAVSALAFKVGSSLSRLLLIVGFLGLFVLAPLLRNFAKVALKRVGLWGKPVVIIGAGTAGNQLIRTLKREWRLGFRPVAVFDERLVPAGEAIEGVPFGGTLEDAVNLAAKYKIDTVIFAMPHTRRERLAPLVSWASVTFRHVVIIPNLGDMTNSAVVARDFAGTFGVQIKQNLLDPWSRRTKRALDLFGAVVGGILVSPLVVAIALLIKLESTGSSFYGHLRIGAGGKHFRCWKFRTMHRDSDRLLDECLRTNPHLRAEWEQMQKLRDDPRVTRIGHFLRKTSLDELPQLWNVLRGEMSLIGPRPIVDAEVPKYGKVYELYKRIRPGISGLWQVSGRSDIDYVERVMMDSCYVRNWSFWLDLVLLVRTVKIVVLGRGAY